MGHNIQHFHGSLNGCRSLVGIQTTGFVFQVPDILPCDNGLNQGICFPPGWDGYQVVGKQRPFFTQFLYIYSTWPS
jgi:hypothetical protein